jgi:hypothetical protein
VTIDAGDGSKLRLHYVDERPSEPAKASGETVLLLHGNPTWSYAMITQAWSKLETIDVPFLCVFSDQDHVTHGNYTHLSSRIPGAKDPPHVVIQGAAHFVRKTRPRSSPGPS